MGWLKPDKFTLAMLVTLAAATFLPARGGASEFVDWIGLCSISLLFFLHGANLSFNAVLKGLGHWRFHSLVVAMTYVAFPIIGVAVAWGGRDLLGHSFSVGLLFLCCLPSTVQSSIALTSIAKGNIPAAVCAASGSNLVGVFVTPALVGFLLAKHTDISLGALQNIAMVILMPFLLGQIMRSIIGQWVVKMRSILSLVDRSSILIMVYAAFGKAVTNGIWQSVTIDQLLVVSICCILILVVAMWLTNLGINIFGLPEEDRPAAVFCGSMKSLVTGIPIAVVLFPAETAGAIVLPLMIYHQMQLIVCAWVARRFCRHMRSNFEGEVADVMN